MISYSVHDAYINMHHDDVLVFISNQFSLYNICSVGTWKWNNFITKSW